MAGRRKVMQEWLKNGSQASNDGSPVIQVAETALAACF